MDRKGRQERASDTIRSSGSVTIRSSGSVRQRARDKPHLVMEADQYSGGVGEANWTNVRQQLLGALLIQVGFTLIGLMCRLLTKERLSDHGSELRRITLKYLLLAFRHSPAHLLAHSLTLGLPLFHSMSL